MFTTCVLPCIRDMCRHRIMHVPPTTTITMKIIIVAMPVRSSSYGYDGSKFRVETVRDYHT